LIERDNSLLLDLSNSSHQCSFVVILLVLLRLLMLHIQDHSTPNIPQI